jgi:GNAT superfamily N-acetyltransferase
MFEILPRTEYARLTPLVEPLGTQHLIVRALLAGSSPGTIYVDRIEHPRSAFIASAEGRFLLGTPTNSEFNLALRAHVETLFAGEREAWEAELVLTCYPDSWGEVLRTTIIPYRPPFISPRRYYRFDTPRVDYQSRLPGGMVFHAVDEALLSDSTYGNLNEILFWVNKDYGSVSAFLVRGFGVCLLHEHNIVSWSLTDCIWEDYCEIGIETDPDYRRRGLATMVTAAMVAECQRRGLNQIGWHCWESNLGSIGVAEGVGFRHQATYNAYVSLYDPLMHLAVQGYTALNKADFRTAAYWYGQVSEMETAPDWVFYQLARCQAMENHPEAAFLSLRRAIEKGWQDKEFLQTHPHFASLRDYAGWSDIIGLMGE